MYSLDCKYYKKSFPTVEELMYDIITTGMDPSYYITKDGIVTEEKAIELISS